MKRIAILVSGRGTNFEAIARSIIDGRIKANLPILIADRKGIGAVEIAKSLNIKWFVVDRGKFESRESFDEEVLTLLKSEGIDLVCLAGYMSIVSGKLLNVFKGRMLNIHPTLLPCFPGIKPHRKVIGYGVRVSGATVHFVDEGVDSGPIVIQSVVPVSPNDTPQVLADKVLVTEHRIYPQAVKWLVEDRLRIIDERKVIVRDADYSRLPFVPALEDF